MSTKTTVTRVGQRYVDRDVYREVSRAAPLAQVVAAMLQNPVPKDIHTLDHIERTPLRWMRPDGRGGLKTHGKHGT